MFIKASKTLLLIKWGLYEPFMNFIEHSLRALKIRLGNKYINLQNMTITIKDLTIDLKYSMRMYIIYENITDEPVDYSKMNSMRVLSTLFYSTIIATLQANKQSLDMNFDEYMDWLDENNGVNILSEYATWLSKQLEVQFELDPQKQKKSDNKKSKKAKD